MATARILYPKFKVESNSVPITNIDSVYISSTVGNPLSTCSMQLVGLSNYGTLIRSKSTTYSIYQAYYNAQAQSQGPWVKRMDFIIEQRSAPITGGNAGFSVSGRDLGCLSAFPWAQKTKRVFGDITYLDTDQKPRKPELTYVSAIVNSILGSTSFGVYDYPLINYEADGYPLDIVNNLVGLVGGYCYRSLEGVWMIEHKLPYQATTPSFTYVDQNDIIELEISDQQQSAYNTVKVDVFIPKMNENFYDASGIGFSQQSPERELFCVIEDTITAASAYAAQPPSDKQITLNISLKVPFAVDGDTIEVFGGHWSEEEQDWIGAKLVEGTWNRIFKTFDVTIPQDYELNKDAYTSMAKDQNGNFLYFTIRGKVYNTSNPASGIPLAEVKATRSETGSGWHLIKNVYTNEQYWIWTTAATIASLTGYTEVAGGTNPPIPADNITVLTNSEGLYEFSNVAAAKYTMTAKKSGYTDAQISADGVLEAAGSGNNLDPPNKYKLKDTKYKLAIYGKREPPIVVFIPKFDELTNPNGLNPGEVGVEVRHSAGITSAGAIIESDTISDDKILTIDTAIVVGSMFIREQQSQIITRRMRLPSNPYLRVGMTIRVIVNRSDLVLDKILFVRSVSVSMSERSAEFFDEVELLEFV